jgi:hypothetical protein
MSKPRRRHDAPRLAFGETVRHSTRRGIVSKRQDFCLSFRPLARLAQVKNANAPAVEARGRGGLE